MINLKIKAMDKIKQYEKFKQYFMFAVLTTSVFETQKPIWFLILITFIGVDFLYTINNAIYLFNLGKFKSLTGIYIWMGLYILIIIYVIIQKKSIWMHLFNF